MARIINGTLYVGSYDSTSYDGTSSGVWSFTNAIFNNQASATGNGSLDILPGFIAIVPSADPNSFLPVPGVAHRYKLVDIVPDSNSDCVHISGTLLWDEGGTEIDLPLSGTYALLSENTLNNQYNLPASDEVYTNLPGGLVNAAYNTNIKVISDKITGSYGATGVQGQTGLQGPTGAQGLTGISGTSGGTGVQGPTGVSGTSGGTGVQGQTGLQGVTGVQGRTGVQGLTGVQGRTGLQGLTGVQGQTGLQGLTGVQGNTGVQGITGIKGKGMNLRYTYDAGVPLTGTRYLRLGQGVFSSSCGDRIPMDTTLSYISTEVDATDSSRSYTVEILSNPAGTPSVLASQVLAVGLRGDSTQVSVGILSGTEIGARMVLSTGYGVSTFNSIVVNIDLTE